MGYLVSRGMVATSVPLLGLFYGVELGEEGRDLRRIARACMWVPLVNFVQDCEVW